MNNENYLNFLDSAESAIKKKESPGFFQLKNFSDDVFRDKNASLSRLSNSLLRSMENLDEELNRFENNFLSKNNAIYWASTYNDVFDQLKKIFKAEKTKSVRIPNVNASTIFRELGIKYFLRDEKIELREDGDIQFFVADFLFSDNGSMLLLNQTNNNLSKLSNHHTNIFFTTIDRLVASSNWTEVIQQTLSYRNGAAKQDMIIFRTSPNCNNYLFIIDNQRSCLLSNKEARQSLICLQCGRCKDVCPVYQTIGDAPYNNVFSGPIANVVLPYLESFETYGHVSMCCTLCGRCEEVCPLNLPLRDMIITNRQYIASNALFGRRYRRMMSVIRKCLSNRKKMNGSRLMKRHLLYKYISPDFKRSRRLPSFAKETFNKEFQKSVHNM